MMNANDSYWLPNPAQKLEGFARIIGCEKCQRTLRTRMVDRYVIDALAKGKISPTTLRGFEHQNRVMGAEVMSENDDLVKVCEAADGGDACPVLAAWDKHSNVEQPRQPDLRGVRDPAADAAAGRHRVLLAGAVRRERPGEHPARPRTRTTRR